MKIMFLPPKPLLTKKGTVRKRAKGMMMPGRVFLENGYEITGLASLMAESEPVRISLGIRTIRSVMPTPRISRLILEFTNPDIVIIDEPPAAVEAIAPATKFKRRKA